MIKLCDYSDTCIVVKRAIDLLADGANENDKEEKDLDAEDVDRFMLMYNLLEYSYNYSRTSGSLWNYYRDEFDDVHVGDSSSDGKSIEYKTKNIRRNTRKTTTAWKSRRRRLAQPPVPSINIEVNIPLKFFSNFWRSLNIPKDCVSIEYHNITGVNFMNISTKLYVPVET